MIEFRMFAPSIKPITVFVSAEQAIVLSGLRLLLEREGFHVVGDAADGPTAVERASELGPDVAVLGENLHGLSGCEASRQIRRAAPHTRVILLIEAEDETRIIEALESGVAGCVSLRDSAADKLFLAIRSVVNGHGYWSGRLSPVTSRPGLSPRERQVLRLIAEGRGTKQIAAMLGLSAKTVEAHRGNLMAKLKLRDVASLVRYAIRQGVIRP
jgi:DNA-binding NarL/FixJ family response regulator